MPSGFETQCSERIGLVPGDVVEGTHMAVTGFPKQGTEWETIKAELQDLKTLDYDWRGGRLPSYIYYYNDDIAQRQAEAYTAYFVENALGEGKTFFSLTRMLEDISAMALDLFHAPKGAGVSFTSGGTESLFEAIRTARKHFRLQKRGSGPLNLVAPYSAHASVNKAGEILDVEIRRVAVRENFRADVDAMANAIDDNTIMLFASAPCYPYGVFDPIRDLGQLALKRNLWLHVDGCWGGFVSPFAKQLGYPIPDWDLAVPGVTSVSADIHKFGYCAKGASLLLFRSQEMKELERFSFDGWPRGTYSTPTFLGSRPAGSIASAWAMMRHLGNAGYLETTKATMDATMTFIKEINAIPGLRCLEPNGESNIYCFVSDDPDVNIMAVADLLQERRWFPGRLREPLGIGQGVNPVHLPIVDKYVSDVRECVELVRKAKLRGAYKEGTY
jgi:sphinganine-1-phosphate aldolase